MRLLDGCLVDKGEQLVYGLRKERRIMDKMVASRLIAESAACDVLVLDFSMSA